MKSETKLLKSVFFAVCALLIVNSVRAALEGEQVVHGKASFDRTTQGTTVINASDRSIINYNRFDILENETVRFIQPDSTSSVLNRVTGSSNPSQILGALNANGKVLIINPAGVVFGKNAVINVGSLIAGAAQIGERDYIEGLNNLSNPTGAVENFGKLNAVEAIHLIGRSVLNEGEINSPVVNLIGRHILNTGVIRAPDGMIGMIVADELYLGKKGSQIFVNLGAPDNPGNAGIENTGTLDAGKGSVYFGAGDIYSLAIRNSGTVKAKEITLDAGDNGSVSLEDGILDASDSNPGEVGGSAKVLGKKIGLFDGAVVDASGAAGGGTVNIGGGFQGEDRALRNATTTYVAEGVTIRADAINSGKGGEIIVWADGLTRFDGFASARGGGFIEVSGKQALQWLDNASADLSAVAGTTGELLLDPETITIVEDVADADINGDGIADEVDDITSIDDLNDISDFPGVDSIISNDAVDDLLSSLEGGILNLFAETLITVDAPIGLGISSVLGGLVFETQQLDINAEIASSVNASFVPADFNSPVVINVGTESVSTSAAFDTLGSNATNTFAVNVNSGSTLSGDVTTGSGNDTITIGNGSTLFGDISTNAGEDTVTLAQGADLSGNIQTGLGNDTVIINEGANVFIIETEEGNDEVQILGGTSEDTFFEELITGDDNDTVFITGNIADVEGESLVFTGGGDDTVEFSGTSFLIGEINTEEGNDTVNFLGTTFISGVEGVGIVNTGEGDDTFNFASNSASRGRFVMGIGDDTAIINEGAAVDGALETGFSFLEVGTDNDGVQILGGTSENTFFESVDTGAEADTILLTGTLSGFDGQSVESAFISTGNGEDIVQLMGTTNLIGDINTGEGDDTITFSGASTLSGLINGGDGDFSGESEVSLESGFDTLDFTESSVATAVDPGGEGPIIIYDEETSGVTVPGSVISGGYENINQVLLPAVTETLILPITEEENERDLSGILIGENDLEFDRVEETIEDALIEELAEIGIYARNNTLEEILQRFGGSTQFLQLIENKQPQLSDYKVAVGRTGKARIMAILDAYHNLLGSDDSDGGIEKIQDTLDQVFEEYYENSEDDVTGPGLRAYIESHQDNELHAKALQYLDGYKNLFVKIKTAGLTPNEIEISKAVLLRRIRISDLTSKELYEAIDADSEVKL